MKSLSILGCGWLGKPLAQAMIRHGFEVSGSTTQESNVATLQDMGIRPFVITPDADVQGSAYQSFFRSDILIISIPPKRKQGQPELYLQQLKAVVKAVQHGKIRKVLFISSTAVYPDKNRIVTEEDADVNDYLVQAETLITTQGNFETTIIRFGGLIGQDRHPGRFLAGKKEVTGGNNPVNMIHQEDCVRIIMAIIQKGTWGETFNACAAQHPTRKEFYTKACKQLGLAPPEFIEQDPSSYKIVSAEKLRKTLAYKFIYDDPMEMI